MSGSARETRPPPFRANLERSLRTLRWAAFKLAVFVVVAGAQGLAGRGFMMPLATMAMWTALLCAAAAAVRQESATAPHYNALDEAAWFFLLGFILRRFA